MYTHKCVYVYILIIYIYIYIDTESERERECFVLSLLILEDNLRTHHVFVSCVLTLGSKRWFASSH